MDGDEEVTPEQMRMAEDCLALIEEAKRDEVLKTRLREACERLITVEAAYRQMAFAADRGRYKDMVFYLAVKVILAKRKEMNL